MIKQILTTLVVGALFVASGCTDSEPLAPLSSHRPLFERAPADGNGNKQVIPIDLHFPDYTTCEGGATLSLHAVGWFQITEVSQVPIAIIPVHLVWTFVNAAGETFVWKEFRTERLYFDENGNLIDALAGRAGFAGNIGRLVLNLTAGDLVEFIAGKEVLAEDLACAALT